MRNHTEPFNPAPGVEASDRRRDLHFDSRFGSVTNLAFRLAYELLLEFEWQLSRVEQLEKSWTRNVLPLSSSCPNTPKTFIALKHDIQQDRDHSKVLLQLSRRKINLSRYRIWAKLMYLVDWREFYKRIFGNLVSSYNERLEAERIFVAGEPSVRLGEQAGIIETAIIAIDKLLRSYCGLVKEQYTDGLVYAGRTSRGWEGISSTVMARDFEIRPRYQIMAIPEKMKLMGHNLLTPVSHEASHFIFKNVRPIEDPNHFNLIQYIHLAYLKFLSEYRISKPTFDLLTVREVEQMTQGEQRSHLREVFDTLDNNKLRYGKGSKDDVMVMELFIDMIAGLIGGPGYFVDLLGYSYYPTHLLEYYREAEGFFHQIPQRTRLMVGECLAKILGIDKFGSTIFFDKEEEPVSWYSMIRESFKAIAPIERTERARVARFRYRIKRKLRSALYEVGHPNAETLGEVLTEEESRFILFEDIIDERDKSAKRIKKLLDTSGKNYVTNLLEYFEVCYASNPSFFGSVDEDSIASEWLKCVNIARKISFGDTVVFDEKPRRIAAASTISPLVGRPFFPTGNFYHSLFLCREEGDCTEEAQEN